MDRCQTTAPPTAESVDRVNSKDVRGENNDLSYYGRLLEIYKCVRDNQGTAVAEINKLDM